MLQLQQQQQQGQQTNNNNMTEKSNVPKPSNGLILEGENADTIVNLKSVSRIINDVNSDSEDSECTCK